MYSPKIKEDLIAPLYHKAKADKKPMTKIVDQILRPQLNGELTMYFKKIKAVYETMTVNEPSCQPFTKFSFPKGVFESFKYLQNETKEHFIALHLNMKNELLCIDTVATGSMSAATVHPREVFKTALLSSATAMVLVHNHPSGSPEPSREDIKLTKNLIEASEIIGIQIHDHIIIGDSYYSFMESGILN